MAQAGIDCCWKLAPGRAHSLRARGDGRLRITQGQAWATLDEIPLGSGKAAGDHFLGPGQELPVRAGRHLVIESLDQQPVHFVWLPRTAAYGIRRSWEDLLQAARLAAGALWRLLAGSAVCLHAAWLPFRRR